MESKNVVQNVPRVGLSTRNSDALPVNKDGSCNIYFGPNAPKGKVSNWMPIGGGFFLRFRLYGPETKSLNKIRLPGDLKKIPWRFELIQLFTDAPLPP